MSPQKADLVKALRAIPIDYRSTSPAEYLETHTAGPGFDIVYDTVGGSTPGASFIVVKQYTGHVISCLGWSSHSLATLSMRGATYSGVFTLLSLLTDERRSHYGNILAKAAILAESADLKVMLSEPVFSTHQIAAAYESVAFGRGKASVEFR